MPTCEPGDVVRLPFPYADRSTFQYRPGLVVASFEEAGRHGIAWVLMITSSRHAPWPGDVDLDACYREAGLPVPSLVRTRRIASIDPRDAVVLGRLPADPWAAVRSELVRALSV